MCWETVGLHIFGLPYSCLVALYRPIMCLVIIIIIIIIQDIVLHEVHIIYIYSKTRHMNIKKILQWNKSEK